MHASMAYVNGAGLLGQTGRRSYIRQLALLNALLGAAAVQPGDDSLDEGKSSDEKQADEESESPNVSRPEGFKNDPDESANPNEVRERFLRKVNR